MGPYPPNPKKISDLIVTSARKAKPAMSQIISSITLELWGVASNGLHP
jgi:hypothetical protein